MSKFRTWMLSSLPRFIIGAGSLFAAPLAIAFLFLAQSDGDLSGKHAVFVVGLSAAGGVVWSLAMWFTVVAPLKKRLAIQRSGKPSL
jgi:hypothetical protein